MAFSSFLSPVRRIGRGFVLPAEQIRQFAAAGIDAPVHTALDLGAGTLWWSYWLADQFGAAVFAVDPYYRDSPEPIEAAYEGRVRL